MNKSKKKIVAVGLLTVFAVNLALPSTAVFNLTGGILDGKTVLAAESRGVFIVRSHDVVTKAPLGGAVFAIFDSTGKEVKRLTTNSAGSMGAYFPVGSYTVKQISAPAGYDVNTAVQSMQVVVGGTTTSTYYNLKQPEQKGILIVRAQDATTKSPLGGVTFAILDSTGKEVKRLTTNSAGSMGEYFPVGNYTVKQVETPSGYSVNTAVQSTQVIVGGTTTLTFSNEKIQNQKGILIVRAQDATTKSPLGGVTFAILDSTGKEVKRLTTNTAGSMGAYFPVGNYTVKQVVVPSGYNMNAVLKNIDVVNGGSTTVSMTNSKAIVVPQTGTVTMKTVDTTGAPLSGVDYNVLNSAGTLVKTVTTDASGSVTITLDAGSYTIKQAKVPTGYELNNSVQPVSVITGSSTTIMMINPKAVVVPKTGTVTVKAIDSSTGDALAGVEYSVIDGAGTVVSKAMTDVSGTATMTVNAGSYTIKQEKVPTGYDINGSSHAVNVVAGGGAVVTMSNSKTVVVPQTGTITVKAADTASGTALSGAEFSFIDASGAIVKTVTTDASGSATVTLKTGSYTVKQSKAPTGYNLHLATYSVDLAAGKGATVTTTNSKAVVVPTTGTIAMKALDMSGAAISGMEFGVFDTNGTLVKTAMTDASGNASVVVPVGSYTVKQTKVPTGYNENTKGQTVNITAGGGASITTMNSKTVVVPQAGTVTIKTLDSITKAPLSGVEFNIVNSSGTIVKTVTTDSTGTALVTLDAGTYMAKETKLPTGYNVSPSTYTVSAIAGGKSTFTVQYMK